MGYKMANVEETCLMRRQKFAVKFTECGGGFGVCATTPTTTTTTSKILDHV